MTAFNVVRFTVKPGNEQRFIDAHRKLSRPSFKGFLGGSLIRTGERTFCMVAEWRTFQSIVKARPEMIAMLDGMRDMLEDLGGGLGVTDPVSGQTVATMPATKVAATKKKAPVRKTRAKKTPAKKKTARAR
jgi:hypothetical protein